MLRSCARSMAGPRAALQQHRSAHAVLTIARSLVLPGQRIVLYRTPFACGNTFGKGRQKQTGHGSRQANTNRQSNIAAANATATTLRSGTELGAAARGDPNDQQRAPPRSVLRPQSGRLARHGWHEPSLKLGRATPAPAPTNAGGVGTGLGAW